MKDEIDVSDEALMRRALEEIATGERDAVYVARAVLEQIKQGKKLDVPFAR